MNWIDLSSELQITHLKELSKDKPLVIFKHSTRCAVSSMAKSRLERSTKPEGLDFYYLDLIHHRALSNKISEVFGVFHESPQILLIKNGECIYDESHSGIQMDDIAAQAALI